MAKSSRQGWPIPTENQDPFYDAFISMVNAQDASVFGLRESRDIMLIGGGTLTFISASSLLSWSSPIDLNSAPTGLKWTIPAGSINVADGQYIYVKLAHNPTTNLNLSVLVGSKLPDTDPDNPFVIGVRQGDRIYFRNGDVLVQGAPYPIFSAGPVGAPTQKWRETVAMVTLQANATLVPKVMGSFTLNPASFALGGTTTSFLFEATASVDNVLTNGTVTLYDLTAATLVATLSYVGATTPTKMNAVVVPVAAEHVYEVRGVVTVGPGEIYVNWAGFLIDNTIT